jgi:hypothetical protein
VSRSNFKLYRYHAVSDLESVSIALKLKSIFIILFLVIPFAAFLCRYIMLDLIASALTLSKEIYPSYEVIVSTYKPSDDALKQMFAYNLFWEPEKSMFLYPKINQDDSLFGSYHHIPNKKERNQCKLGFIDILDENGLRESKQIANEIFGKFRLNDSKDSYF